VIFNYDRKVQRPSSSVNLKQKSSDNFQDTYKTPNTHDVNQDHLMDDYVQDTSVAKVSHFLL
jgi:hypothetical protein